MESFRNETVGLTDVITNRDNLTECIFLSVMKFIKHIIVNYFGKYYVVMSRMSNINLALYFESHTLSMAIL